MTCSLSHFYQQTYLWPLLRLRKELLKMSNQLQQLRWRSVGEYVSQKNKTFGKHMEVIGSACRAECMGKGHLSRKLQINSD